MWKYRIGTVVRQKDGSFFGNYTGKDAQPKFGHVTGFKRIEWDTCFETILLVKWEDETETPIHPERVITEDEVTE